MLQYNCKTLVYLGVSCTCSTPNKSVPAATLIATACHLDRIFRECEAVLIC